MLFGSVTLNSQSAVSNTPLHISRLSLRTYSCVVNLRNHSPCLMMQVVANNPQDHVIDYEASLQTALTLHFTRQFRPGIPSISTIGNSIQSPSPPRTPSGSPPRTPTRPTSPEALGTGTSAEEMSPMRSPSSTPTAGDSGNSTSTVYVAAEDDEEFRVDIPLTDGDVSAVSRLGASIDMHKS